MNSDILYRYYKAYIEEANNNNKLDIIKEDILKAKHQNILASLHYAKLIRFIIKRKKENKISETA